MDDDPTRALDDEVAGCASAHQQLMAHLDDLLESGLETRAPSLLPDWSVGHVLTHLARNADALRHMIEGAVANEERPMYPSLETRAAAIEAGSGRDPEDIVSDLRLSNWSLEKAWARLTEKQWNAYGLARGGRVVVHSFPFRRWREVEIHHSDLGLDFTPAQWSPAFLVSELPRRRNEFIADGGVVPDEVSAATPWQQLAWLFARDSKLTTPTPSWG